MGLQCEGRDPNEGRADEADGRMMEMRRHDAEELEQEMPQQQYGDMDQGDYGS